MRAADDAERTRRRDGHVHGPREPHAARAARRQPYQAERGAVDGPGLGGAEGSGRLRPALSAPASARARGLKPGETTCDLRLWAAVKNGLLARVTGSLFTA